MVTDRLVAEGLVYEGAKAFATPRRLALTVHGLPARQSDLKEERKGPRVGGPQAAIAGFLKAAGLASLDEAKIQRDPKKGDFYVALIEKPGRATLEVLAEMLPVIIRTFPWPKSMRWGERSARPGALSWVRPLHAITATFGLETEEPDVVKFTVDGLPGKSFEGKVTRYSYALDEASKTMLAEIELQNPKLELRPGMYAIVKIGIEHKEDAPLLPVDALVTEKAGTSVFVVNEGTAKKTRVQTGFNDGTNVEILKGVNPDQQVILAGKQPPNDGQPVTISEGK